MNNYVRGFSLNSIRVLYPRKQKNKKSSSSSTFPKATQKCLGKVFRHSNQLYTDYKQIDGSKTKMSSVH